jgi:exopolysaccharide production protein ExoQ
MRLPVKSVENILLGAGAFVLSGALLEILLPGETALAGNPAFKLVLTVLYLGVCLVAFRRFHRQETLRILRRNPAIVGLLLLTCASCFWAALPSFSLQRSAAVVGATLVGITLAGTRSTADQLRLLNGVFRLIALLCLGCMIVAPHVAWSSLGLEGIFNQKNNLGQAMAVALLIDRYLPRDRPRAVLSRIAWPCIYTFLLILSRSASSLVSLCAAFSVAFVYRQLRERARIPLGAVLLGIGCTVAAFGLIVSDDSLLPSFVGRSADLTGRTELWRLVRSMILKRPLLGYGYASFWGGVSPGSTEIAKRIGWVPQYSHNGYLELALSLGFVGAALFALTFAAGLFRAVKSAEIRDHVDRPAHMWPLSFLIFFAVHNMAECTILWQNSLEWAIFVATVIGSGIVLTHETEEDTAHSRSDCVSYAAT